MEDKNTGRPPKKPGVAPAIRRDWLRRSEELGENIAEISEKDHYDRRTVQKQLDLARQEREIRETRMIVLRDAVKEHYEDLIQFSSKIQTEITRGNAISIISTDRLYTALKQHLPKSPLWKLLNSWEKVQNDIETARSDLKRKLEVDFRADREISREFTKGIPNFEGMVKLFMEQSEFWKMGSSGFDMNSNFRTKDKDKDFVEIHIGGYAIGSCLKANAEALKKAFLDYKIRFDNSAEFVQLKKTDVSLRKLIPSIDEELAIITMRRIVPGHCKYCPL